MTDIMKALVLRAGNDFPAMYEAADQIARSNEATREQVDAAKVVRRSIASVMTRPTDMRMQVARQRFEKLVSLF
jgi:hypothetical protein